MSDGLSPAEREQLLRLDIRQEVERLRGTGVRVSWRDDDNWEPDEVAFLTQWLDDGVWDLVLGGSASRREQLWALERTWALLLTRSDLDNRVWYVRAADPDDVLSAPLRRTAMLRPVPCG